MTANVHAACRTIPGGNDERDREVRISCPDATGLGCDISRLLLDFGLKIMDGESITPPSPHITRRMHLTCRGT